MTVGANKRISDNSKIMTFIENCNEAEKLRQIIANAHKQKNIEVGDAAFRRLVTILPSEQPGTVDFELWRTIYALEHVLSVERNRTTLLSRTRQKLKRSTVREALTDWALRPEATQGFTMLVERKMPELTGEAIILRHSGEFSAHVVEAAKRRLDEAGVDLEHLPNGLGD